jgi:hypothetical protein
MNNNIEAKVIAISGATEASLDGKNSFVFFWPIAIPRR